VLQENKSSSADACKVIVISVSPQARASLAVKHKLQTNEAALALSSFFKGLGAKFVLDTTYAREIALLKSAEEFMDR